MSNTQHTRYGNYTKCITIFNINWMFHRRKLSRKIRVWNHMNGEIEVQSGFNISTFAYLYLMAGINYVRKYLKVLLFTYNLLYIHTYIHTLQWHGKLSKSWSSFKKSTHHIQSHMQMTYNRNLHKDIAHTFIYLVDLDYVTLEMKFECYLVNHCWLLNTKQ